MAKAFGGLQLKFYTYGCMPHGLYVGGLSLIWHEAQFHIPDIGSIVCRACRLRLHTRLTKEPRLRRVWRQMLPGCFLSIRRGCVKKAVYAEIVGTHGSCNAVQIWHRYGGEARMRFKTIAGGGATA